MKYRIQWAKDYEAKFKKLEEKGLYPIVLRPIGLSDDEKQEITSELNRISEHMEVTVKHLARLNDLLKTDVVLTIWLSDYMLEAYYEPSASSYVFTIYTGGEVRCEVGKVIFSRIPSISY